MKTRISPRTGLPVRPYNRATATKTKSAKSAKAKTKTIVAKPRAAKAAKTRARRKTIGNGLNAVTGMGYGSSNFSNFGTLTDRDLQQAADNMRAQQTRDQLFNLAQAVWLSHVNASGIIVQGDDVRHYVRQARIFMSEINSATEPKTKPATTDLTPTSPTANVESLDELLS